MPAPGIWLARRHPHSRRLVAFERALALVILAGWAGEYVADAVLGMWSVDYALPLQLTDLISLRPCLRCGPAGSCSPS